MGSMASRRTCTLPMVSQRTSCSGWPRGRSRGSRAHPAVATAQDEARRGVPEPWQFSPSRLRGHRERLGLSRNALGAKIGKRMDTIKVYEYGITPPSLSAFLSLADSLGISPNDLCRQTPRDDEAEYLEGRTWSPTPPSRK